MKIKMRDTQLVAESRSSNLEMPSICICQRSLILLLTEQVDRMNRAILLHEVEEMSLKGRLGRMRSCDLDSLTKGLQALLFPEYFEGYIVSHTQNR
jgi:hypothetical protein